MTSPPWSLRRLHALDEAQIDGLADALIDCVEGGASVRGWKNDPFAAGSLERRPASPTINDVHLLEARMGDRRFILNAGRTSKQGQQINVGKDHDEYQAIVSILTMHPEDMKSLGIAPGATVRVRSAFGEATFRCQEGKVPLGMIFVPYGPPTCRLMPGETDGTGMPTSKGWEVEVEPVPPA